MPSRHSDRGRALSAANETAPPSDMYNAVTAALEEKLSPEELYPAALNSKQPQLQGMWDMLARNALAQTAGFAGDIDEIGFLLSSNLPGGKENIGGISSGLPNSEEMAEILGGNPGDPSWPVASVLAPGPGEILAGAKVAGKALLGGGKALLAGSVAGFPVLASRVERRIRKNVNRIDEIQDAIELRKSYGASDESLEKLIKEQKQLEFENRGLFDELSREAAKPTTSGVVQKHKVRDDLPNVEEGFTRLFRAEGGKYSYEDVWDVKTIEEANPDKLPGEFFTDNLDYADYYKETYGKGAEIVYVDVPTKDLGKYKAANPGEYVIPNTKPTTSGPK